MEWRQHIARFGTSRLPGEPWARKCFLVLFALACVLRFWNLPHLPYTHDELSALGRLYPTLDETIQKGVIQLDTHPPGVQIFEWLWTRVFTLEEADVKLPFIIMDLLALFLLYRFALAWTGSGPALVLTTLMAALQYSVLYGQIARPYAVGLFTTALLADQLTRYLAFGERRILIGVGIAAVLSAYTHHFALLLAAIMVGTGLLLVQRERRKAYVIMCCVAALLYLPNVPIFLHQLGQGGLTEWLQAPTSDWIPDYARFIANDNSFLMGLLVIAVGASLVLTLIHVRSNSPSRWFLLAWGILPLAIGYGYSVWRAPVLQYSMLLFSFPYLVLFFVQGLVHLPRKVVLVGCFILACVSVNSLVQDRKHYTLFYRSKYEVMLREGLDAVKAQGKDHTLVLFDAPDHVQRFYLDLWKIPVEDIGYVQLRDRFSAGELDSILVANSGRTVIYGQSSGSRPENLSLIQQRFPKLVERQDLVDGQVFQFSSGSIPIEHFDRDTIALLDPMRTIGAWNIDQLPKMYDTVGVASGWDYTGREFGIAVDLALDSIVFDPGDQVEVIAEVEGWDASSDASVVADVRMADSTVFYRGGTLDARHRPGPHATMAVSICPADIAHTSPLTLRTYVYSPTKGTLHVRRMAVLVRQANPVRYGTIEPVPWLGRFPAR